MLSKQVVNMWNQHFPGIVQNCFQTAQNSVFARSFTIVLNSSLEKCKISKTMMKCWFQMCVCKSDFNLSVIGFLHNKAMSGNIEMNAECRTIGRLAPSVRDKSGELSRGK